MNRDQQCLLNSIREAHSQEQWDPAGTLCTFALLLPKVLLCLCTGVGPASVMVGNLVAGKRIAQASGRDLGQIEDNDLVKKVNQYL